MTSLLLAYFYSHKESMIKKAPAQTEERLPVKDKN